MTVAREGYRINPTMLRFLRYGPIGPVMMFVTSTTLSGMALVARVGYSVATVEYWWVCRAAHSIDESNMGCCCRWLERVWRSIGVSVKPIQEREILIDFHENQLHTELVTGNENVSSADAVLPAIQPWYSSWT